MTTGTLLGWGYEGRTLDDFLATLRDWRIDTVADVRLTPISRKKGFSKTRLREACESVGTAYVHLRGLGNPKDNRAGFARERRDDGGARQRFHEEVLSTEIGAEELHVLASLRDDGKRILVLCFEADESCCHRREILSAVRSLELSEIR